MSLDVTAMSKVFKEIYPKDVVDIDYKRARTLALLRKEKGTLQETPFGAGIAIPFKWANNQAQSADFTTGYNEAANAKSRYDRWFLTPSEFFGHPRVTGEAMRRSGSSVGAFVKAGTKEIESVKLGMTRSLEIMLGRSGWGDVATLADSSINTSMATTTVYLKESWMVRHVDVGQILVASATQAADALRSATALRVVGRSLSAGTITLSANASTQSWTAGDTIFLAGNRQNLGSSAAVQKVPMGFGAWLPTSAPSSTAFFSVDRTVDDRLGGLRWDATKSGTLEDACLDASSEIKSAGGRTTHAVCGDRTYNKVVKSLRNKQEIDIQTQIPGVGFKGVMIHGASGDFALYSDSAFSEGNIYLFDIDDVGMYYTGDDLITIDRTDGLTFRSVAATDDWQAKLICSCQFYHEAPGWGSVIYNA